MSAEYELSTQRCDILCELQWCCVPVDRYMALFFVGGRRNRGTRFLDSEEESACECMGEGQ